jgi:hypothetical protein
VKQFLLCECPLTSDLVWLLVNRLI